MAKAQEVRCIRRCWDSKTTRRYYPGDVAMVDPLNPVAVHFAGWAPGTIVYTKIRGTKTTPAKSGTVKIPGKIETPADVAPAETPAGPPAGEMCTACGKGPFTNIGAHKQHCKKSQG